jgi:hypothetical protein
MENFSREEVVFANIVISMSLDQDNNHKVQITQ